MSPPPKKSGTAARSPQPPSLRAFSRSLPMALLKAREAVMARFRPMLREHALTEQQWRVLRALDGQPAALRAGEVAALTYLSLPSLSRLLRTLEARGVVAREAHADDLRAAQLSLTPAGRTLVRRIGRSSEASYAAITGAIGARDVERLYALLEAVETRLAQPAAAPRAGRAARTTSDAR